MKLYVQTKSGAGLGLGVLVTGKIRESSGAISSVEVMLPVACDYVYGVVMAKSPSGRVLLWVDAADICADDGALATQEELRAEVERVNKRDRDDMLRGPLGGNWP